MSRQQNRQHRVGKQNQELCVPNMKFSFVSKFNFLAIVVVVAIIVVIYIVIFLIVVVALTSCYRWLPS